MSLSLDRLPINVFDVVCVAVLIAGILRGRKHGMSEELMNVLKWLLIVVGCSMFYERAGDFLSQSAPFSRLASFIMVYVTGAAIILGCFALVRHSLGGKLVGSDIFGGAEYYLGMGAGLVRFGCMLLAALALLNARYFSPQEVKAMEKFQNDAYGSNFFPTLQSIQSSVFEKSLSGPWIREHLSCLLIKPTKPEAREVKKRTLELP
jgi:uncharacterized membrane protein required for colicin V production